MARQKIWAGAAVGLFALLLGIEQVRSNEPFDLFNLFFDVFEMALLGSAVFFTATYSSQTQAMQRERKELMRDLRDARADSARWRASARVHVDGLSQAIAAQFSDWQLTAAEADVASLLLKGLAHKEIAGLRQCAEATVRQHAASVYRKSGLVSRAQLTAYFLEDLLSPNENNGSLRVVDASRR